MHTFDQLTNPQTVPQSTIVSAVGRSLTTRKPANVVAQGMAKASACAVLVLVLVLVLIVLATLVEVAEVEVETEFD